MIPDRPIRRRSFLRSVGLGMAATIPAAWCSSVRGQAEGEQPLFRFVQLSDAHVDASVPNDYRLANEKLEFLVRAINAATFFPVPDFVLATGDMIHGENLASLPEDTELLTRILAPLKCPCYEVFEDRVCVSMHSLPHELVTPETDIHGKPRFPIDYTDPGHDTHELYVRGGPEERVLELVASRPGCLPGRGKGVSG